MTAERPDARDPWSAGLYAGFVILTMGMALAGSDAMLPLAILLLATYLVLELPRIPAAQRWVGVLLACAGLLLGALNNVLTGVVAEAVQRSLQFLVLFSAVACLRMPALQSPSLMAVGRHLISQPPGRRFLALAAGSHLFGSFLNLAGLQLVASMLSGSSSPKLRQRLSLAMLRGFCAGTSWSPLFVSTAVVLSVLPGLTWLDVAPTGLAIAALLILSAWMVDRLTRSRASTSASTPAGPAAAGRDWGGMGLIFLGLCLPVLALVEGAGLAIPIAIGLVGPVHAAFWLRTINGKHGSGRAIASTLVCQMRAQLPALRSEVLLFTAASLFGTGVAAAAAGESLPFAPPTGDAAIAVIVAIVALFGLIGLHPVIPIIILCQITPPAVLDLSPQVVANTMMASFGLATLISPFSGTTLYVGRLLQTPVWTVAWRWNAAYGLGATILVSLALMGLRRVLGG